MNTWFLNNHGQYVLRRNFGTIVRNAFLILGSVRGGTGWSATVCLELARHAATAIDATNVCA